MEGVQGQVWHPALSETSGKGYGRLWYTHLPCLPLNTTYHRRHRRMLSLITLWEHAEERKHDISMIEQIIWKWHAHSILNVGWMLLGYSRKVQERNIWYDRCMLSPIRYWVYLESMSDVIGILAATIWRQHKAKFYHINMQDITNVIPLSTQCLSDEHEDNMQHVIAVSAVRTFS